MFTIKQLKIITYNVNSIYSIYKRVALNLFVKNRKPDILFLQETNLSERNILSQDGYEAFQTSRSDSRRGTAILLKNPLKGHKVSVTGLITSEATAISLQINTNESFLFISLYIFSGSSKADIQKDLSTISLLCSQHTYCLLGGDFNARHTLWHDDMITIPGKAIVDWLKEHSYEHSFVVISQSEKTYPRTPSLLDFFIGSSNIFCILPEIQNYQCSAYTSDSDHLAVELSIHLNQTLLTICRSINHNINYSKINWTQFKKTASNLVALPPSNRNLCNNEIDDAILNFEFAINEALEEQKWPKMSNDKFNHLPSNIQAIQAHRQRLRKKLQRILHRTLNRENIEYRRIQSELRCTDILFKESVRQFQNEDLNKRLRRIKPGPDTFRQIGFLVGKKNRFPDTITRDNIRISESDKKAEALADFFEENFTDCPPQHLPELISSVENKISEIEEINPNLIEFSEINTAISPADTNNFINPSEIKVIIKGSNQKKSSGRDNIPNKVLHKLPELVITFLTIIFNNCINNCYFPQAWKIAKIIPIPKKNNRSDVSDFRPISLICCVSKLLESIIMKKIVQHCDNHNIIPNNQHGFRKQRSTIHPLLKLHNHVTSGLNKNECTVACLLDVQKAFDTVWIKGLIYKMSSMLFPSPLLKLILNFLKDRFFFVQIGMNKSARKTISAGVVQGSKLGPVLFNIYTSDQPRNDNRTRTMLYADDSITYASSISPEIAARRVERHIHSLWFYYQKWGLKINSAKSELICFRNSTTRIHRKGFANHCRHLQLKLPNDCVINTSNSIKYLGINFTERFTFNFHAYSILSKANYAMHLINPLLRRHNGLNKSTKLLLYKQLIRPILTYGYPVWFTISPTIMNHISVFERKILRLCIEDRPDPNTHKLKPNYLLYQHSKVPPIKSFMLGLAKKILRRLENHEDDDLRRIFLQETITAHSYLHTTILINPRFEEEDEEGFYTKRNPNKFRG
jgi:hypothetical protein